MKPIDAEFLGYQEHISKHDLTRASCARVLYSAKCDCITLKPIALFNIVKRGHKAFQSTVSALTLEREGLNIPEFPSFETWKITQLRNIDDETRCNEDCCY